MNAILPTRRLELRPCAPDDLDALHALFTDADVRRWLWDDVVIPRERVAEVIEASAGSFAATGYGIWVLRARNREEVVGFAGLRVIEGSDEVELLYGLWPTRWGQGLAAEASRAVLCHGFEACGLPRIAGRVDTPNTASIRVLERLGMEPEGESFVDGRPTAHFRLEAERFLAVGGD